MSTDSALGNGIEGLARWSLRLFGGFELSVLPGGERVASPGKRERVLLAYLALSPNSRQPRRKLAALLWGDATDETALDNLRTCVWGLRKALGDTEHRVIASEGEDIVLNAAAFEVDALAFRRLAAQSGRSDLKEAANLYSGEFLDGLGLESEEFESWRRGEAARYRDRIVDVLTRLMTQLSECGETERAIETGVRILRLEPLHEAAVRRLMRLYGESGRRGAAVQLYRTFADGLRTELAALPEAETRVVFAEVSRGGEERTSGASAADTKDTKLPPRSTRMARPSDAPDGPLRLPTRPFFRWRAPLAILAGVLIVAAALISYRPFAFLGTIAESPQAAVAERAISAPQASAISIVVLPFTNLSGDASQEFFSDGMTEEITAALAKVPNLRVVARTSAFQFKGQNQDVRVVGQSLGASHVIEGSVRKVDNRVRISAQLIDAGNGTHLWTENYDGDLTDIFAVQEEIAQAIAKALRVPLGLQQGQRLVSNRTNDVDSYQQYLRAKALVASRGLRPLADAAALLEQVVARDADFAPAWALLAQAYALTPTYHPAVRSGTTDEARPVVDASLPKAEVAAQRAIQLDANSASGYLSLGLARAVRGKFAIAEQLYSKALVLDPNNPDALHLYGYLLAEVGRVKEAIAIRQQLLALEPFVPVYKGNTALALWLNGQDTAAIALLKTLAPGDGFRAYNLARIYASADRYNEAADELLAVPRGDQEIRTAAVRLLRTAPATAASPQTLPRLGVLGFVYVNVGALDRALDYQESTVDAGFVSLAETLTIWHPAYTRVRKTERFKTYVRKAGLVDYWRAKGWPEFCHPTGADDFVCA